MGLFLDETSLEWHSVLDALRNIYVDKARATLGTNGAVAYTDGACIKNPGGPAGWSVILWATSDTVDGKPRQGAPSIECYGHIPKAESTTNNRAEIAAVLAALSIASPDLPLKIYSDSEYTIKVASGIYQMKANSDLWALYRTLLQRRKSPPTFEWVRGHAGHAQNERADELAGLGAWNGDRNAYEKWQASAVYETHTVPPSAELEALRQQVQKLKTFFDGAPTDNRISAPEREFIADMAKSLQKNKFVPSPKQTNWVNVLVKKYRL